MIETFERTFEASFYPEIIEPKKQKSELGHRQARAGNLYSEAIEQRLTSQMPTALLNWDALRPSVSVRPEKDLWAEATIALLHQSRFYRPIKPMIDERPSVQPLSDRERFVLNGLYPLISRAARIYHVQELRIVTSRFIDTEENKHKLVVTQWINLPVEPAFQYWDKMATMVENWMSLLPDALKPISERIDVEIEWNVTGASDDRILRSTRVP